MRLRTFSENIATEGTEIKTGGIDLTKVENAVKRVAGVTSFSFDPKTKEITVGYGGLAKNVKDIKIAVDGQSVSCEILSPARVVVRPIGALEDPTNALNAMKGVAGVTGVNKEFNDLVAYADLSTTSLDALKAAVEGTGVKCQIASHEEVKVKYTAAGNVETLRDDLSKTKWVLKVEVDSAKMEVRVLCVKGRVTRSIVGSVMNKHGFPEAK